MDKIYIAVPPDYITEATSIRCGIAYMAYRIANNGRLLRASIPKQTNGGIIYIDNNGPVSFNGALAGDIIRECITRQYSGVVLDLSPDFPKDMANMIAAACTKSRIKLFVTPHLAYCQNSLVLISTGISSGSLSGRLSSALEQYGAGRVALDIDYLRTDYTMPASDAAGQPLSDEQLNAIISRYRSPSFFSKDLCTYYFTYRLAGKSHFVLYDNAVSLRRKLALGKSLGIDTAFMYYPHVKNVIKRVIEN